MTTIVYRDGVLAADSRSSYGDTITPAEERKLHRLPDGSVAAGCGTTATIQKVIAGIVAGEVFEFENATVVRLPLEGDLQVFESGAVFTHPRDMFMAWGSGMDPALGALYAGCAAERAVEIACQVDKHSGLPVRAMRPEAPSPAPVKKLAAKSRRR